MNNRRLLRINLLAAAFTLIPASAAVSDAIGGPQFVRQGQVRWKITEASYYGSAFAGKPTACGGTFDPGVPMIASPTLPCGTEVMLCSYGDTCVKAKVGDRGPYRSDALPRLVPHPWRDFDLSTGACDQLHYRTDTPIAYCVVPDGGSANDCMSTRPPWITAELATKGPLDHEETYSCDPGRHLASLE